MFQPILPARPVLEPLPDRAPPGSTSVSKQNLRQLLKKGAVGGSRAAPKSTSALKIKKVQKVQKILITFPKPDFRYTTIFRDPNPILGTQRHFRGPELDFRYTTIFTKSTVNVSYFELSSSPNCKKHSKYKLFCTFQLSTLQKAQ